MERGGAAAAAEGPKQQQQQLRRWQLQNGRMAGRGADRRLAHQHARRRSAQGRQARRSRDCRHRRPRREAEMTAELGSGATGRRLGGAGRRGQAGKLGSACWRHLAALTHRTQHLRSWPPTCKVAGGFRFGQHKTSSQQSSEQQSCCILMSWHAQPPPNRATCPLIHLASR